VHTQAYAEHRLGQLGYHFDQAGPMELLHAVRRGADARQDDMARRSDRRLIGGPDALYPETIERSGQRSDIRAAAVDNCDCGFQLSIPLVDGISSPLRCSA
jgi:hypothetical protein